jgi:hypothetical protein
MSRIVKKVKSILSLKDVREDKPVTHWFKVIRKATGLSNKEILTLVNEENSKYFERWGTNWGLRRPVCQVAENLKVKLPSVPFDTRINKYVNVWEG